MRKVNVTVFKCDQCGKSVEADGYKYNDDVPDGWIRPYDSDTSFSIGRKITLDVPWDNVHLCSIECMQAYFTEQFKKAYTEKINAIELGTEETAS